MRPLVDTLASARHATLAGSRPRPGLPALTPRTPRREWLPSPPPALGPDPGPSGAPAASADAAVEEAIRTLRRGVGIVFAEEPRWHARPAVSQVSFC